MPKIDTDDEGFIDDVKSLVAIVQNYAKQETLGPLKGVGRYLAFGVAGSVALALGVMFLLLSALRALQTQTGTALTGNWSWVPYLVTVVAAVLVIGLAARAITRNPDGGAS